MIYKPYRSCNKNSLWIQLTAHRSRDTAEYQRLRKIIGILLRPPLRTPSAVSHSFRLFRTTRSRAQRCRSNLPLACIFLVQHRSCTLHTGPRAGNRTTSRTSPSTLAPAPRDPGIAGNRHPQPKDPPRALSQPARSNTSRVKKSCCQSYLPPRVSRSGLIACTGAPCCASTDAASTFNACKRGRARVINGQCDGLTKEDYI